MANLVVIFLTTLFSGNLQVPEETPTQKDFLEIQVALDDFDHKCPPAVLDLP